MKNYEVFAVSNIAKITVLRSNGTNF